MEAVSKAYEIMYIGVLICLALGMIAALIRTIVGPRVVDRIIGVNMIGTLTMIAIVVLSFYMKQDWLLDVAFIYCMISFLAVVVLAKTYITAYKTKDNEKGKQGGDKQ